MALSPLFFYGTLRHVPLLEIVLGRDQTDMQLVAASAPDHAVHGAGDGQLPMIVSSVGGAATGLLLLEPTPEDVARLAYYHAGLGHVAREITVQDQTGQTHEALAYGPPDGRVHPSDPWSLEVWERDWAEIAVGAAREAMEHYGQWSVDDLVVKMPMLRRRAATMVAARHRTPPPHHHAGADQVEVISRQRVHSHFFALDQMVVRHPRYDGTMTDPLDREAFFAGQAVVLLPYDPVRDEVIVVEQFRANMYALGDPSPWMIEAVLGLIDPGETAAEAGTREAQEEAGVRAERLELVSEAYSSTGSSTEFVTIYVALADFGDLGQGGGLDGEGEDIRRLVLPFDDFAAALNRREFRDAPLITAGFWLMLNRERLRSSA